MACVVLPFSSAGSLRCATQLLGHLVATSPRRSPASAFYRRTRITALCSSPFSLARKYSTGPHSRQSDPNASTGSYPEPSSRNGTNKASPLKTSTPTLKATHSTPTSNPHNETEEEHRSSDPAVPNPSSDDELPSLSESRRDQISAAIQNWMDNLQRTATEASNWASNATGTSYRAIERLKKQNADLETQLAKSREQLNTARKEYQTIVQRRLQTQREVNTLLARKDGWTPQDLERFTSLYRDDHTLDASVAAASTALAAAERETEKLRERLISGILGRYHEEQIWSDRIRRLSTWGTWGLMGVNVLLFLLFQFGAEPWRRARLTRGFEEKVAEGVKKVLEEERARVGAKTASEPVITPLVAVSEEPQGVPVEEIGSPTKIEPPAAAVESTEPVPTPILKPEFEPETWVSAWSRRRDFLLTPGRWKPALLDLASDRMVWLRMRDVSLLVAEGVAAGAVLTGAVVVLVMRR